MIWRFLNNKIKPVWNQLYIDIGGGPECCVFVAGTERSGTTWLAECINYRNDYRFLFEPFWPEKVPESAWLRPQEYVRPGGGSEEQRYAAAQILKGAVRNPWVDKYHRRFLPRRRLIKDVRANLYLKWLSETFSEMPVILLIRHPCAVAKSQMDRKHGFASVEETFLSQPALVDDFLRPFVQEIRDDHSPFEDRIFRWAIQNYVPLRQFSENEIVVTFYEDLCTAPEAEFKRIFNHIAEEYQPAVLQAAERPSPMSQADSAVNTGQDLVEAWQSVVPASDVSAAVDILRLFGLESIYGSQSMPQHDGLARFRRA